MTYVVVFAVGVACAGLLMALVFHRRAQSAVAQAARQSEQGSEVWLATVEALACAIEARARSTQTDRHREQEYAAALARALDLTPAEIETVKMASVLRDVGKLAVPEYILTKKGPLTPDELEKVRVHVQVGADILARVPFPYPVTQLVQCHHERWDGTGYPSGLKGSAIPIGARILSVVDHFVALTSDRPFRSALTRDEAVALLWRESGSALDPILVSRFVELLPRLEVADDAALPKRRATDRLPDLNDETPLPDSTTTVFDEIVHAHRESHALYEVAQAMSTSLGIADAMGVIAGKLGDLVPFSSCALFLNDGVTGVIQCRFAIGAGATALRQLSQRSGVGLAGQVVASRQTVMNGDPAEDFAAADVASDHAGLRSALVCPLIVGSNVIGALAMYHTEAAFFTEAHRRRAIQVAGQAAPVIHNSVLFERKHEESVTDELTGLPNNRFLILHLTRELARARRRSSSLAVVMLDLDNLKDLNDGYGHLTGDRALREVASIMRRAIRPYDAVARYGGDEFIVVLSDCGAADAEAKRAELQQVIDNLPFAVRGTQRVRLAISAGAAIFPADGDTYDLLIAAADAAMYRDKSQRKRMASLADRGGSQAE